VPCAACVGGVHPPYKGGRRPGLRSLSVISSGKPGAVDFWKPVVLHETPPLPARVVHRRFPKAADLVTMLCVWLDGAALRMSMKLGGFLLLLTGMALPSPTVGRIADGVCPLLPQTKTQDAKSKSGTYIVNAYADEVTARADPLNRCPETDHLHILYSDGAETIRAFQLGSNASYSFGRQVGFSSIRIASDKQTVGWTEDYYLGLWSSTPLILGIYRNGNVIFRQAVGGAIWYWEFTDSGNRVGVISGPSHGNWCGEYQLYDVGTGKMLSYFHRDRGDDPCVRSSDPEWAQQLEKDSGN
jgi:hypothetical protein